MMSRSSARVVCGLCAVAALVSACSSSRKPPRPVQVQPIVTRDVNPLLRGTIGAEAELRGVQPILVSGLGLVVGLNGTGGDVLPENVAATMERTMGLMGVGQGDSFRGTALEGKTPSQILRDPNTAVVIVQAAIPPGAPANSQFDVVVKALNASNLEGGTLWTTDLRLGQPAVFEAVQARAIAKARGPIFINPFSERGHETEGVTRTIGRVLGGGWVTDPFQLELVLDSNSHARARAVVSAINSRFPQGPGDPMQTARGRTVTDAGGSIALHIPQRYRNQASEFLALIAHLPIDHAFPEQQARRLVEGVKAEPVLAENVSWCLEGLGNRALPFIRQLYEFPELAPRMAGLRAGARLGDAVAAGPLKEIAKNGSGATRMKAIELLGVLEGGPTVDAALRELLEATQLEVRVAAYEALAQRVTRIQVERLRAMIESNPDGPKLSPTRLEVLAQERWPRRNYQGIERVLVGEKFYLDIVPYGEPLIYLTQQGQPRIVIFGENVDLAKPAIASAWGDRLLVATQEGQPNARVRYSPPGGEAPVNGEVQADLVRLIQYFAHKATAEDPKPGLDMSYSDVVGALEALCRTGATRAAFATEQDRLKAQVLAAAAGGDQVERPEKPGDEPIVLYNAPEVLKPDGPKEQAVPKIVPIEPPAKK